MASRALPAEVTQATHAQPWNKYLAVPLAVSTLAVRA
jgi:hypothetical protein